MFEQTFKNIDDSLRKDAGCATELDYIEQTSWLLFLKYLDDLETEREYAAQLTEKKYQPILEPKFRWQTWAAPKLENGKIDHNAATGDDLRDFVNQQLFPYLQKFKPASDDDHDSIQDKIGVIFSELKNRLQSGYTLREVINQIDNLRFSTHAEKHEMSHLYESKIKNMGNAGRNGGEYYTPRPLIRTIVKVVNPKIGETIYDGAAGSAGFLCEAFDHLNTKNLSTAQSEFLQKKTFLGREKKGLAYVIGIMNMIFHGIEAPNIQRVNTLAEFNLADFQERHRHHIVLANPPFGGKERDEVQQNFPIRTSETASLFLQHFIKILRAGGRAGIVIKNTFLSNTDNASIALRRMLLDDCQLHTILDLPGGTFTGAGVKTVVLFFEKGAPSADIWYYQLNLDRNLGKTNPLNENDLKDFVNLQKTRADSPNSWTIRRNQIPPETCDLSVKNPNKKTDTDQRTPAQILQEIHDLDREAARLIHLLNDLV